MRGYGARILVAALTASAILALPVTAAQAAPSVSFDATLNGRPTSTLSTNDPLVLRRGAPLRIAVSVHNDSGRPITVAAARVQGRVMGLSFFSFDTQLNLVVAPGTTRNTSFDIGLTGLADQADGLLPTTVSLLDNNSDELSTQDITVDVKGKLTSIYGIFGLAIAAITLLWLVSLLYRVSRRALPENRWQRAVQFSAAGFGVGLALTFSVSALRLLTPDAAVWAPFVFGAGAVGLALGYLTPGPRPVDPDEEADFIAARERQYARIGSGSDENHLASGAPQPALGTAGSDPALEGPAPRSWGAAPPAVGGAPASPAVSHAPAPAPAVGHAPAPPAVGGAPAPAPARAEGAGPAAGHHRPAESGPATPPSPERDTTVQASRSDLDSIFGSEYGSGERGQR